MTAHFNLTVLREEPIKNTNFNAPKPEAEVVDAAPSTSTVEEETYVKIPSRNNNTSNNTKRLQPTGAVLPTLDRDYELVKGYEVMSLMILGAAILILLTCSTSTITPTT